MEELTAPEALQKWRSDHAMTQADLAQRFGAAQSTLSLWETGGRRPGLARALEIQVLTGIPATAWGYTDAELARLRAAFAPASGDRPSHTPEPPARAA